MSTLLLSAADKPVRGRAQDLRRTLLQLLHGFQAIENALTIFALPFTPNDDLLSAKGDILAEFDGHVGDTACHLRGQMLWEVYEHYKPTERREWVPLALEALSRVKAATVLFMLELHGRSGHLNALGIGKMLSYGEIFDRVGWSGFMDMFDNQVCRTF